jgi:hypothetical protein
MQNNKDLFHEFYNRLRDQWGNEPSSSKMLAERGFACSRCRSLAGTVQLFTHPESPYVSISSFRSSLVARVSAETLDHLREIISAGDARALYAVDCEFAPFFCPCCKACYCGDHWETWDVFEKDGWFDCVRGRCPAGHERILED